MSSIYCPARMPLWFSGPKKTLRNYCGWAVRARLYRRCSTCSGATIPEGMLIINSNPSSRRMTDCDSLELLRLDWNFPRSVGLMWAKLGGSSRPSG